MENSYLSIFLYFFYIAVLLFLIIGLGLFTFYGHQAGNPIELIYVLTGFNIITIITLLVVLMRQGYLFIYPNEGKMTFRNLFLKQEYGLEELHFEPIRWLGNFKFRSNGKTYYVLYLWLKCDLIKAQKQFARIQKETQRE